MKIKIKDVELKSNVILAPMAGFTDMAFRHMCLEAGAGLVCTEMVSSKALHYKNQKTEELLKIVKKDIKKLEKQLLKTKEVSEEELASVKAEYNF